MTDARFHTRAGPFRLSVLAELAGASIADDADGDAEYHGVAPLDSAGAGEISFLDNRRYVAALADSAAGACIIDPAMASKAPPGMALMLASAPYRAYALVARAFHPHAALVASIAASAHIDAEAVIGEEVQVSAGAVVGAGAEIGARCLIGANAVIGDGVVIGPDGVIGANVTISHALIGARVLIHPGAAIGQDGFGFAQDGAKHLKVPQLGRVLIDDDVEIGANTSIDRGSGPDTVIGAGCIIDNLVQIGHNVVIGRGCVIVAQVGISGSTRIGDHVMIGGQGGLAGHLEIGAGARLAAQCGVMRNVEPGAIVGGSPAVAVRQWHRQTTALARLAKGKDK